MTAEMDLISSMMALFVDGAVTKHCQTVKVLFNNVESAQTAYNFRMPNFVIP